MIQRILPFALFALLPANLHAAEPLRVFFLAGQSNMQGHAKISTLDYMAEDPSSASLLQELRDPQGSPKVCERVWISSIGCTGGGVSDLVEQKGKLTVGYGASPEKIGPEFSFGVTMEKAFTGNILIIKTSWGGKNLLTDFRPPSAGNRHFDASMRKRWQEKGIDPEEEIRKHNEELNGVFYRHMIAHVRSVLSDPRRVVPDYDPSQGYEISGFVWFQGFNDLVDSWSYPNRMQPGGYDEYANLLGHFIRDVRRDLAAPKMPFIIGVMGIGGDKEGIKPPHMHFRQAQTSVASLPEFQGNVIAVPTAPFWCDELGAIDAKRDQVNQMRYFLNSKHKDHANADGAMTEAQKNEYVRDYEAKLISPEESALWKKGASNAAYHYLGCGKTFARMGKAFAEANVQMLQSTKRP